MRAPVLASLAALALAGPCFAQPAEDTTASDEKAFAEAFPTLSCMADWTATEKCQKALADIRAAADKGNVKAEFSLGSLLLLGQGKLPKDPEQGLSLIHKAADQGLVEAQRQLGLVYSNGFIAGIPQDQAQSIAWYRKAAAQGDAASEDILALDYSMGMNGLAKDPDKALSLYQSAASQGDMMAQTFLAQMYERGDGVPRDDAQAFFWNRKLADQGLSDAALKVGAAYAMGKGAPRDYVKAYAWIATAIARKREDGADSDRLALNSVATHLSPTQLKEAKRQAAQLSAEER